jgi:hypothetical protein
VVRHLSCALLLGMNAQAHGQACNAPAATATDVVISVIHERQGIEAARDRVYVDGQRVGTLDLGGSLCYRVSAAAVEDLHSILVVSRGETGETFFQVSPGHQVEVAVVVSETAEASDPARLVIEGLDHGIYLLASHSPPLRLSVLDLGAGGAPVLLKEGHFRVALRIGPGVSVDVTGYAHPVAGWKEVSLDLGGALHRYLTDRRLSFECCRIEIGASPDADLYFREEAVIQVRATQSGADSRS